MIVVTRGFQNNLFYRLNLIIIIIINSAGDNVLNLLLDEPKNIGRLLSIIIVVQHTIM